MLIGEAGEGDEEPGQEWRIDVAEGAGGVEVGAKIEGAGTGEELGEIAEFARVDGLDGGVGGPDGDAQEDGGADEGEGASWAEGEGQGNDYNGSKHAKVNRDGGGRYTADVRRSQICPRCGCELARVRGVWNDDVGRHVVKCPGSRTGGGCACDVVVVRGVPLRKQILELIRPVMAVVLLVASVVVWTGGAAVCASGALLMCLELFSVMQYGGTVSSWSSVVMLAILSAAGAGVAGAWTGMVLKEGVTWRRWAVFVVLTCVAMLWALLTTTAIGDLVSGRGLSAVRGFVWGAVAVMSGFWWLGGGCGMLVRWVAGSSRGALWRRRLAGARQMRPIRA